MYTFKKGLDWEKKTNVWRKEVRCMYNVEGGRKKAAGEKLTLNKSPNSNQISAIEKKSYVTLGGGVTKRWLSVVLKREGEKDFGHSLSS